MRRQLRRPACAAQSTLLRAPVSCGRGRRCTHVSAASVACTDFSAWAPSPSSARILAHYDRRFDARDSQPPVARRWLAHYVAQRSICSRANLPTCYARARERRVTQPRRVELDAALPGRANAAGLATSGHVPAGRVPSGDKGAAGARGRRGPVAVEMWQVTPRRRQYHKHTCASCFMPPLKPLKQDSVRRRARVPLSPRPARQADVRRGAQRTASFITPRLRHTTPACTCRRSMRPPAQRATRGLAAGKPARLALRRDRGGASFVRVIQSAQSGVCSGFVGCARNAVAAR